jgi:putative hemolysin
MPLPHTSSLVYPIAPHSLPTRPLDQPPYLVTFASTPEDLDAVLRLRFDVFNLELREGFAESYETGRDEDAFDRVMHHLMVIKMPEREVVGTYRIQTAAMAAANLGFYTATEFDLSSLPTALTTQAIEIGRACISRPHRNRLVLFMLWKGLAAYMLHNQQRYLFGCCSLTSQDPAEGWRAYAHLAAEDHLHPEYRLPALPGYECEEPVSRAEGVEAERAASASDAKSPIPQLFRTYLRYGAKVCGPPVIDRQFGTIDFFMLLDVQQLAPAVFEAYFQSVPI